MRKISGVATEAQNGYSFGMIPEYGLRDGRLSSLTPSGSPDGKLSTAPDYYRCPSRRPCLMGRGVNHTFHSQMSTPDHPLHQITMEKFIFCRITPGMNHL